MTAARRTALAGVTSRRRRPRRDRGAAAVEFAIVLPVLLVLVLGMIELSFVMRDHLAASNAVRTGARSAISGAGDGCVIGAGATCVPSLAYSAANTMEKAGLGMPRDAIDYILIFKANDVGFPGANGVSTMPTRAACGTTVANCVVFAWDQSANAGLGALVYSSGVWNTSQLNACLPTPDQMGVYMRLNHKYLSRMFGATLAISDRAMMRFQPLEPTRCLPNQHA